MSDLDHLRRRVARKAYDCADGTSVYCTPISDGDAHLEVTSLPGQNAKDAVAGHPIRRRQCVYCAAVDGNDYLISPIPVGQDYRYWDLDSQEISKRKRL